MRRSLRRTFFRPESVAIFVSLSAQSQLAREFRARAFRALVSRFSSTRSKTRSTFSWNIKLNGWQKSKFYSKQIGNETSLFTNQKATSFPRSLSLLRGSEYSNGICTYDLPGHLWETRRAICHTTRPMCVFKIVADFCYFWYIIIIHTYHWTCNRMGFWQLASLRT